MDYGIYAGDTSKTIYVWLQDSSTGLAKTGLAYNSSGVVFSYNLPLAARAAITPATQTVTGAWSSGGFVEIDATNSKGLYRLDLPDAAIASGAYSVITIQFTGVQTATVLIPLHLRKVNATQLAGTNLTGRDIGASVLLSSGTGTGQLKLASGYVAMTWADVAAPTTSVNLSGTTIATTQKVDVETIKTNPVVNAGTVTFPTGATLASTTNITAGTITTVTTTTNVTTVNGLAANVITAASTAADYVTEVQSGLATAVNLATVAGYLDTEIASILTAVGTTIPGQIAALNNITAASVVTAMGTGTFLTAIPWNASWDTEVQSEVQDAIEVNHLDHLLAATYDPASKPGAADALLNELVGNDGGVSQFTANALELAPSGGGGGSTDWDADERTAIRAILGIPASGTTPDDPSTGILDTIRDTAAGLASQTSVDNLPTNAELATALSGILPTALEDYWDDITYVPAGTTLTLSGDSTGGHFVGSGNATIALNSQEISGATFEGLTISGTGVVSGTEPLFQDCILSTGVAIGPFRAIRTGIDGTVTLSASANPRRYVLMQCYPSSRSTGATFDFTSAVSAAILRMRFWTGGATFNGLKTGDAATVESVVGATYTINSMSAGTVQVRSAGSSGVTIADTCSGGSVTIAGNPGVITNNSPGGATTVDYDNALINKLYPFVSGTSSGAGSGTEIFVGAGVTGTSTVDDDGNRSAVVFT